MSRPLQGLLGCAVAFGHGACLSVLSDQEDLWKLVVLSFGHLSVVRVRVRVREGL